MGLMIVASLSFSQQVQYSDEAERHFREGLTLFSAGRFRDAAASFDFVAREYPSSQRTTAALIMKAKAVYRLNENLDAAKLLKAFLAQYPSSAYVTDAELMLGSIYARIDRHGEAIAMFVSAWRDIHPSTPAKLEREIIAALDASIDGRASISTLEDYVRQSRSSAERAYFWTKIGERSIALENVAASGVAVDTLMKYYPANPFADRLWAMRGRVSARSSVKIGALVPLMRSSDASAIKEIGNEVYEGIQFAVEQMGHDPFSRIRIALDTKDTERENVVAARGAREFAEDSSIIAVIGPVFSPTAAAAAGVLGARRLPMVTPTANANGIAAEGPGIFQANPDYDTRGSAMALYAVRQRGMHTLAVLAPSDTYGKLMAESFIREASQLGARVIATEWYQKGMSDLKDQLGNIRRAGMIEGADPMISFRGKIGQNDILTLLKYGVPLKRIDSLMNKGAVVNLTWLLGINGKSRIDSLGLKITYDLAHVDSLEYQVESIDGIYVPISGPGEIGVISSQIVYFNFHTQLLGSGEWNNFGELNANKRYCTGIVFESDSYADTSNMIYAGFLREYAQRFRKAPTKNTLYGYDATMMVLKAIAAGATTRETVLRALAATKSFQGVHSRIGFTTGRVNGWLPIFKYEGDRITKIDDVFAEAPSKEARPGIPGR